MMDNLNVVRGVVTNLQITKGYEDFAFSENDKNADGAGAVVVATMQTTPQTDTSIKEIRIKMNPAPGLPILLARYCVVPKDIPNALPAWAGAGHVKDINIGSDYHYALRTLRAGFVYIFYDKNPTGSNQWECNTVNTDGSGVNGFFAVNSPIVFATLALLILLSVATRTVALFKLWKQWQAKKENRAFNDSFWSVRERSIAKKAAEGSKGDLMTAISVFHAAPPFMRHIVAAIADRLKPVV